MNIFLQLLIGFLIADFVTGLAHWFEDTYLDYFTEIPGLKTIAQENELHHYFPRAMLAESMFENVETTIPLLCLLLIILIFSKRKWFVKAPFLMASIFIFSLLGNAAHRVCHYRDCESNDFFRLLQSVGIICTHDHHRKHHQRPTSRYCLWTPYSNYVLDGMNFWKGLESLIFFFTSIKPNKKMGYDGYRSIHTEFHENSKLDCPNPVTKEDVKILIEILDNFKRVQNTTSCPLE